MAPTVVCMAQGYSSARRSLEVKRHNSPKRHACSSLQAGCSHVAGVKATHQSLPTPLTRFSEVSPDLMTIALWPPAPGLLVISRAVLAARAG